MNTLFKIFIILLLTLPASTNASVIGWDFAGGVFQPLQTAWNSVIRGNYFQSTSTTQTNIFPLLSATTATATNFSVTERLNLFGTIGTALSDFCVAITGGSGLCDGNDATGGGGGSSISTSSVPTAGKVAYWTSDTTLSDVATGTLTENILGIDLDNSTRGLLGGSALFSLTSGYEIPTTTRMNTWDAAFLWGNHAVAGYDQVTTAGDGLTRTVNDFDCDTASGTTFGCLSSANWTTFNSKQDTITAGDALTLTGTDIDFDGGTVPAGALGGTWASPSVDDDGHNHTGATLSGIDISNDTNLSGDTEVVLTGDALSLGTNLTFTSATTTNIDVTGSLTLFGGGAKTTANAVCIQLTGSSDLCDGTDATGGGGGGASDWNQSILAGVLSPSTTIGIRVNASSTFLGALTIASTTPDFNNTIFEVATSSYNSGDLFSVEATSSLMNHTSTIADFTQDSGTRVSIGSHGYYGITGLLDQLVLHGRMRNPDLFIADCPNAVGATTVSAPAPTSCTGFYFGRDTTATLTAVAGNGYTYGQLGSATANTGSGVFVSGASAGWLRLATSTPSLEVTARIGTIVVNASSTKYIIGYSNLATAGTTYEVEPTVGCFFIASSTQANWIATCKTASGVGTVVNTGVSSTTVSLGAGQWRTFRIDADADNARFYIKEGSGNMKLVADINTTYPTTQALNAGIHWGRSAGTQAIQFDFFGLNVQWRKFTPNL